MDKKKIKFKNQIQVEKLLALDYQVEKQRLHVEKLLAIDNQVEKQQPLDRGQKLPAIDDQVETFLRDLN